MLSGPFGLTLIILLVLAFSVWGIGDIFRNYDVGTLARIGDREVDSQEFYFVTIEKSIEYRMN